MAAESNGYRAARASRRLTPGRTSSSPGTAESPPFICFLIIRLPDSSSLEEVRRRIGAWCAGRRANEGIHSLLLVVIIGLRRLLKHGARPRGGCIRTADGHPGINGLARRNRQ